MCRCEEVPRGGTSPALPPYDERVPTGVPGDLVQVCLSLGEVSHPRRSARFRNPSREKGFGFRAGSPSGKIPVRFSWPGFFASGGRLGGGW